ncbi:MAG: AbrB/MazE/SpoVT family DNA-binding domain-containing protein [Candidatus Methanoperedenaceae archaeon]|nr:AbrB/MazE/SpoVT family DNA-binding domain-containing protein [Candidatus Methanoperedenaceae archaeon]
MQTVDGKLWRNYQMLIPPEVAEALVLKPGNNLRFVIDGNKVSLEKVGT